MLLSFQRFVQNIPRCMFNYYSANQSAGVEHILPHHGSSRKFGDMKIFCVNEWEKDGVKMCSVYFDNHATKEVEYVNQVIYTMRKCKMSIGVCR